MPVKTTMEISLTIEQRKAAELGHPKFSCILLGAPLGRIAGAVFVPDLLVAVEKGPFWRDQKASTGKEGEREKSFCGACLIRTAPSAK